MKKNFLFGLLALMLAGAGFGGISMAENTITTKALALSTAKVNTMNLKTNVYNTKNSQTTNPLTDFGDDVKNNYYVEVASMTDDITSASYAGYDLDSEFSLSIGNNSFIKSKVLEVKEKKLYIAAVVLVMELKDGNTKLTINGTEYEISGDETFNELTISGIGSNGALNTADIDGTTVTYHYNNDLTTSPRSEYLTFLIEGVTNSDLALTKKGVGSYGLTETDGTVNGKNGYGLGFYPTKTNNNSIEYSFVAINDSGIIGKSQNYTVITKIKYGITILESTNGTISASKIAEIGKGEEIELTVSPNAGYKLNNLVVKNGDVNVDVTDNKFTMPMSDVTVSAVFSAIDYTVTISSEIANGTVTANKSTANIGDTITLKATPNTNYNFTSWTVKDADNNEVTVSNDKFTMPASDVTVSATFTAKPASYSGGGGGGSSRSSSKITTADDTKKVEDTSKTDETKADESKSDENNADEAKTSEEAKAAADAQALKDGYSQEFIDAYNFARKNNITTKDTIREADMDAPLTRIAMAKMLSQYAINVLGKEPDTTKVVPTFPDVDAKLDADYNNGVTLAYQLGIMGIGIDKFRPDDLVTRAEFGTALSRMLFGLEDGEGNEWYSTHLAKLMEEKIITNNNPDLQELRGYVMIMLMRSAQ